MGVGRVKAVSYEYQRLDGGSVDLLYTAALGEIANGTSVGTDRPAVESPSSEGVVGSRRQIMQASCEGLDWGDQHGLCCGQV